MTVDADISTSEDLFGKIVTDLQSGIIIGDNAITGTLKYVDDYTGFSGDPELQKGNYIVIHSSVPNVSGVTISVKVTNPVTLDADGIAVLRIADKDSQTITVVASKVGYESVSKTYSLTELVCEEEEAIEEPGPGE